MSKLFLNAATHGHGTSFVLAVCLLLMVTQAARPEVQGSIKGQKITSASTGACPPKPIVSWTSVTPPRLNSSLMYNVFCCGRKNRKHCQKPQLHEQELKLCCQKSANQSGIKLSCDVTGALRDIYKPDAYPVPQTFLYTVIAVTDGANYTRYSWRHGRVNLQPRNIICTEPSNFTATVSSGNVRLSWGMPPRMACTSFQFKVRYSLVPDGCSDEANQKDTEMARQTYYANSNKTKFQEIAHVHSKLKPQRDYIFKLTCDVFEEDESSAVVVKVRTLPRAPIEGPQNLQLGNPVYFSKKRNITLTWKAPEASCPAKWNGKPLKFLLQYFPIHKSNNSASPNWTASNHERDVSKLSNVTIVDINPSSNSAVIGYLSRYQKYAVNLAMCNEAGCSPVTETVITSEPEPTAQVLEMKKGRAGKGGTVWVVVTASVTGAIIALVVMVTYVKRKRSSEPDNGQAKPPLDYIVAGISPSEQPSYSTALVLSLIQDNADYVEAS